MTQALRGRPKGTVKVCENIQTKLERRRFMEELRMKVRALKEDGMNSLQAFDYLKERHPDLKLEDVNKVWI